MQESAQPYPDVGGSGPADAAAAQKPQWPLRDFLFTFLLLGMLGVVTIAISPEGRSRTIIVVAGTVTTWTLIVQAVIERILPAAGPRKSLRSWLLNFQINIFFNGLLAFTTLLTYLSCAWLAQYLGLELGLIDIHFGSSENVLILIGAVWLSAITSDFFFYWYHRTQHMVPLFWQHHKMHHIDTELEAVSANRQNWMEVIFIAIFLTIPMVFLFRTTTADQWSEGIIVGLVISAFYSFLTLSHMNVRWQVGWASRFWCSPQIHRIHHSIEPQHRDRNFAVVFPLWDVIFGTYCHPAKDEFPATGVPGETGIRGFWDAEIYSPREWLKYIRNRRSEIAQR